MMSATLLNTIKFGLHDLNMIAGVQVKYADRQKFSNTGYGYQYNEGGKSLWITGL